MYTLVRGSDKKLHQWNKYVYVLGSRLHGHKTLARRRKVIRHSLAFVKPGSYGNCREVLAALKAVELASRRGK